MAAITAESVVEQVRTAGKGGGLNGVKITFDLETIPDPKLADRKPEEKVEDVVFEEPNLGILTGSADEAINYLKKTRLAHDGLCKLIARETLGKDRAGVKKELNRRCDIIAAVAGTGKPPKEHSLCPEYCSVCAMGIAINDCPPVGFVTDDPDDERELLSAWWKLVEQARSVEGFNIIGFDLPVIFVRTIMLDLTPTRKFDMRPWGTDVYDVYAKRFPRMKSKDHPGKMKDLAPLYGIDVPADDVDGSQVYELYQSDRALLKKYVESDVIVARELCSALRPFFT